MNHIIELIRQLILTIFSLCKATKTRPDKGCRGIWGH